MSNFGLTFTGVSTIAIDDPQEDKIFSFPSGVSITPDAIEVFVEEFLARRAGELLATD